MLLTAQRVFSSATQRQGVNVYRFAHGDLWWDRMQPFFHPEQNPGELVQQWLQIEPGGNHVVSYLDVVAPDGVDQLDLHQRLASLKYRLRPVANFVEDDWPPYWIRFGTAVTRVPAMTELGALAGSVLLRISGR